MSTRGLKSELKIKKGVLNPEFEANPQAILALKLMNVQTVSWGQPCRPLDIFLVSEFSLNL